MNSLLVQLNTDIVTNMQTKTASQKDPLNSGNLRDV